MYDPVAELTIIKDKKGYTVRDKHGNSASAATKQAAINVFNALYRTKIQQPDVFQSTRYDIKFPTNFVD